VPAAAHAPAGLRAPSGRRPRVADALLVGALVLFAGSAWLQQRPPVDDEALPTPVGIDRSGRSTGPIRRFASVIVNGIEYSTADATILVDGRPATQEDLRIGQVVTVDGLRDETDTLGIASVVEYRSNVVGPITAVDPAASTLVVLGQSVRVSADTGIDDRIAAPALANLRVGDVLAVSGFETSTGAINATRLERADDTGEYRVAATISAFDEDNATFVLGGLLVDFDRAAIQGELADDVPVRVIGGLNGGTLRATRVVVEAGGELADDGESMDLEGLVSAVTSPTTFVVDDQPILIDAATQFIGGTAANLRADVRVLVRGSVSAGVLRAARVEFALVSTLRVEGVVRSTSSGGTRLNVDGVAVLVDARTQFEDNSAVKESPFGPEDLRVGDFVEVAGVPAGGGRMLALRVERDELEATTLLRGNVTANLGGRLGINGAVVNIDMRTEIVDGNGVRMSWNQLIRRARVGDRIKAKCFAIPGGLRAKEIEYSGPAR
jgi:hypothetical protein